MILQLLTKARVLIMEQSIVTQEMHDLFTGIKSQGTTILSWNQKCDATKVLLNCSTGELDCIEINLLLCYFDEVEELFTEWLASNT